jgi:hypothetical protein
MRTSPERDRLLALSDERDKWMALAEDIGRQMYRAGYAAGQLAEKRRADAAWAARPPLDIHAGGPSHAQLEERRWGPGGRRAVILRYLRDRLEGHGLGGTANADLRLKLLGALAGEPVTDPAALTAAQAAAASEALYRIEREAGEAGQPAATVLRRAAEYASAYQNMAEAW